MDITATARFLAAILNSEECQEILAEEKGIEGPLFVTSEEVLSVLKGNHEGITAEEIIAVAKIVCAVMGQVCPIINGL